MKKVSLLALSLVSLASFAAPAFAAEDFDIKKVDLQLITTPQYSVNPPAKQSRAQTWIAVETTFDARPEFTNELLFTYYIAFMNVPEAVYVGRISHVSIQKGQALHSIAYISPKSISRILKGKQLTQGDVDNITVTISKPGISAPIAVKSLRPTGGEWWTVRQMEEGFVLNKSETPFAPLAWDYYEALKPASAR